MNVLLEWEYRAQEEAHLFNPAFCGALTYEFVKAFTKASGQEGAELPLAFCALPISLHWRTRKKLPASIRTSVYTWLQRNPEVLVGYGIRAKNLVPFIREGISFGAARKTLAFTELGHIKLGAEKAVFNPKFIQDSATHEVGEIILSTRMIGRWFASAGTTTTTLAAWGITV